MLVVAIPFLGGLIVSEWHLLAKIASKKSINLTLLSHKRIDSPLRIFRGFFPHLMGKKAKDSKFNDKNGKKFGGRL